MSQTRLGSLAEAVVNTFVGLLVAFVAQITIVRAYGMALSWQDNLIIVSWMTVISVLRTYVIRRMWNKHFWKDIPFLVATLTGGRKRGN